MQRRKITLNKIFMVTAEERGGTQADIRKQFVFALFWKRLYLDGDRSWLLLGGNALLIRTGGGRYTSDVDLSHNGVWEDPSELQRELQSKFEAGADLDEFDFQVVKVEAHSDPDALGYGTKTATVTVLVLLGGKQFEQFKIDVTSRKFVDGSVEMLPLEPVFEDPALSNLPNIPTVAVENHVADKISAMYGVYGRNGRPSTRYRDLADIVRILSGHLSQDGRDVTIDAARLDRALTSEAGRRQMTRPTYFRSPGPLWESEFSKQAVGFARYPGEFIELKAALAYAGGALDEVLSRRRTVGTWSARAGAWSTNLEDAED